MGEAGEIDPVKLEQLPARLFSETMRDLELAVSRRSLPNILLTATFVLS